MSTTILKEFPMSKKAFRAESGLDSGGHFVRNVQTAPNNVDKSLGTNVEYFIRENTIQEFDKTRPYAKGFAVTYRRRIWVADVNILASEFDQDLWTPIRTDPKWRIINRIDPLYPNGYVIESGEYISVSSRYINEDQEMKFILPTTPIEGDTIVIKDEGMYCNTRKIIIESTAKLFDSGKATELFTIPGSMKTLIYSTTNGGVWIVHTSVDKIHSKFAFKTKDPHQLATGDQIYLNSASGTIDLQLPHYAVEGDTISVYDMDEMVKINGMNIQVYPNTGHSVFASGLPRYSDNSSATHNYVFSASNNLWELHIDDQSVKIKSITGDYTALPKENISIVGGSGTLTVTLPKDANDGDCVRLSNFYRIDGLTVKIKVTDASTHNIVGNAAMFAYPKFKNLPNAMDKIPLSKEISFSGNNLGAVADFYFDDKDNAWVAVYTQTRIEHVDETNRNRPGVAPLADQNEVNKNHEQNPRDDMIVTPKTLANSTATDTRRGIARLATTAELQTTTANVIASTAESMVGTIVTPKTLNSRQATETIRGVAEVATTAEAKDNNNDTHIMTPKKVDQRRATDSQAGSVKTIQSGNPASTRSAAGTGVYNWNASTHTEPYVLTPKSLNDAQATEHSRGTAYIATQSEVNSQGVAASNRVIVTPKTLDARRSTETMAGLVETATQAEVNAGSLHMPYTVTPNTLHNRKATESMWGLTEIATQGEVNAGTTDFHFVSPLKFKTWLAYDHFTPNEVSGIRRSGNLWSKVGLDITVATEAQRGTLEVATQAEANSIASSASDIHIITPKKLNARRATPDMAGIAEIATQTEVNAQADVTRIVTPKTLSDYIHGSATSYMSETTNGTGHTCTMVETWVGNTTAGSTQTYDKYVHAPYVVTPRGLNYALANYLPKTAKAVDSDKLDGLDSLQFLRSDVSDTFTGTLTLNGQLKVSHNNDQIQAIRGNSIAKMTTSTTDGEYLFGGSKTTETGDIIHDYIRIGRDKFQYTTNIRNTYNVYHEGHKPTPAEVGCYSKGEADGRFVNATGDTMTGTLTSNPSAATTYSFVRLPTYVSNAKTYLRKFSGGNGVTIWHETVQGNSYRLSVGDTDTDTQFEVASAVANAPRGYRVGGTTVIESDAKINWNKLKGVPAATTTIAGIVQLTDSLTDNSITKAATARSIRVLKDMIDEKADITGGAMEDMKVKNWLQIGNVILRPNKATKSLDFIWTDVL